MVIYSVVVSKLSDTAEVRQKLSLVTEKEKMRLKFLQKKENNESMEVR